MPDQPCAAKIRPFSDDREITCGLPEHGSSKQHVGTLRDYAYPGSSTEIFWFENDRRSFRGTWVRCDIIDKTANYRPCVFPAFHRGLHSGAKD